MKNVLFVFYCLPLFFCQRLPSQTSNSNNLWKEEDLLPLLGLQLALNPPCTSLPTASVGTETQLPEGASVYCLSSLGPFPFTSPGNRYGFTLVSGYQRLTNSFCRTLEFPLYLEVRNQNGDLIGSSEWLNPFQGDFTFSSTDTLSVTFTGLVDPEDYTCRGMRVTSTLSPPKLYWQQI